MELFEQIRREYKHGGGTIQGVAKKLGIHRRMVREAVLSAVPRERKTPIQSDPSWSQRGPSSMRFWKRTRTRHGSSGTPHIGFGAGSVRKCRK